jgi:hypothetical protein
LLDREWIIIDAETHSMVTQRQVAELALIRTKLEGPNSTSPFTDPSCDAQYLTLQKDDQIFSVDLYKTKSLSEEEQKQVEVQIWKQPAVGIDEGDEVAWWLHNTLKSKFDDPEAKTPKYRLLRFKQDFSRQVS